MDLSEPVVHDLAVIGGGVNGCGIARDAAGRGASVVLLEQGDLAQGTSSASTKLIHGGLRYLEHYAFRLVREALAERAVLWRNAPHIIWPLRFVLPHHRDLRPAWLLRLGLLAYDTLGGRSALPRARGLDLTRDPAGGPLKPDFVRGFSYSDCWVEDARLVVLNARDAAERGASVRVGTRVRAARREGGLWSLAVSGPDGGTETLRARTLVDAAGPRVGALWGSAAAPVRLVQGSHIVTRRLFDHAGAYIFQNADRRIVFAIPYEGAFTLIGTTDRDFTGDPAAVAASPEEIAYLCAAVSAYFRRPVAAADVVWSFSGLRPLHDDGAAEAQAATRDYVLALDAPAGAAPLLSVYGGKITTYRRLAEAALARLAQQLPVLGGPSWTASAPLPGGDFPVTGFDALVADLRSGRPWLPPALAVRLARAYGTRAARILAGAGALADLGPVYGADLTAAEVRYLIAEEWARSAEDVLWRRSKLGLRFTDRETAVLSAAMAGDSPA